MITATKIESNKPSLNHEEKEMTVIINGSFSGEADLFKVFDDVCFYRITQITWTINSVGTFSLGYKFGDVFTTLINMSGNNTISFSDSMSYLLDGYLVGKPVPLTLNIEAFEKTDNFTIVIKGFRKDKQTWITAN